MKNIFWAGSEESFQEYMDAKPKAEALRSAFEARVAQDPTAEPEFPPIYERVGDVGVVTISGTLIPGAAEFYRFFDMLGYEDIKEGLLQAVQDREAKSIMLMIDSPGGDVNGVADATAFAKSVAAVKPMTAYAEFMCSAAYWVGSTASHITAGPTSDVGSLGVLRVHTEYTKALASEGITKTVLRAGRYKALGGPYETLGEDARAVFQSRLDDLYGMFMQNVAENLGTTAEVVDKRMGQGRVFMGKRAVEAGLADEVGDFQSALAYASANRRPGAKRTVNFADTATSEVVEGTSIADNAATRTPIGPKMKLKLTTEQLAAIAAGATVEQATGMTSEQVAAAEAEQSAEEAAEAARLAQEAAEAAANAAANTGNEETVNPLTADLEAANAQIATLTAELATANERATALEAEQAPLLEIARSVVGNLAVALGKKVDIAAMDAATVAATHAEFQPLLVKKFPVGGAAASTASTEEEKPKVAPKTGNVVAALFSPRMAAAAKSIQVPNRK